MNQFDTTENVDAYCELANAVVVLACDDYCDYKKHFRKNLDLMKYISERMDEIEQSNGGCTSEWDVLETVKADTEFDQRKLLSKISEIEKFLLSDYGMMLSHGLGDAILEKIQNEHPTMGPSAERGYAF